MENQAEYRAIKAHNFSAIKEILPPNTPAHYRWRMDNPMEPSEALDEGTLSHLVLLQPDEIEKSFTYYDNQFPDYRTKEARIARDNFVSQAEAAGKTVILGKDKYDHIMARRTACWNHGTASWLLEQPGEVEYSIRWDIDINDIPVPCKGRCDKVFTVDGVHFMLDVKTCQDASDYAISKLIFRDRRYDMQAGMYVDGYFRQTGKSISRFYFIFVEKETNIVRCEYLDIEDIERGMRHYYKAIELIEYCSARNEWPAYAQYCDTDLPIRNFHKIENDYWGNLPVESLFMANKNQM